MSAPSYPRRVSPRTTGPVIVRLAECRLTPTVNAAVNSPCDETVGRARGPARGMGEMRGDPGALPAGWGYWEYGYHADICREICCSHLKFHKGILKR